MVKLHDKTTTYMKTRSLILIVAAIMISSCATVKYIPMEEEYNKEWKNRSYSEIVMEYGAPDRVEYDGKDGSILVYEKITTIETTDVNTHFGMFDPDYKTMISTDKEYVHFFLGRDDICYLVKSNQTYADPKSQKKARAAFWSGFTGICLLPFLVVIAMAGF